MNSRLKWQACLSLALLTVPNALWQMSCMFSSPLGWDFELIFTYQLLHHDWSLWGGDYRELQGAEWQSWSSAPGWGMLEGAGKSESEVCGIFLDFRLNNCSHYEARRRVICRSDPLPWMVQRELYFTSVSCKDWVTNHLIAKDSLWKRRLGGFIQMTEK